MFGTLQDRLIKKLAKAGITEIAAANAFIRDVYLPQHNACFAKPAAVAETELVTADPMLLAETLCIEEERVVGRDNTVAYGGRRLQLPESATRAHHVKAKVKVREYPSGELAVFHGPRRIARYSREGGAAPPGPDTLKRDTVLAAVTPSGQVGTEKRPSGRTKKLVKDDVSPTLTTQT